MIYANLKHNLNYLDSKVKKCIDYISNNNLSEYKTGVHNIENDDFFVNIVEYETTTEKNRFWEAHKKYIDVHFMIFGQERINLCFIEDTEIKGYEEQKDFVLLDGKNTSSVLLKQGDFLVCYPEDAHMTALANGNNMNVKKAIFKIKI